MMKRMFFSGVAVLMVLVIGCGDEPTPLETETENEANIQPGIEGGTVQEPTGQQGNLTKKVRVQSQSGKYAITIDKIKVTWVTRGPSAYSISLTIENNSADLIYLSPDHFWLEDTDEGVVLKQLGSPLIKGPEVLKPRGKTEGFEVTFKGILLYFYPLQGEPKLLCLLGGETLELDLSAFREKFSVPPGPIPELEPEPKPELKPLVKAAYIINGTAETLSVFDLETRKLANDVMMVGKWPADIKVWDDQVYVVSTGDNEIQIIDPETLIEVGIIHTGDGTGPERIDFVNSRKAYASCLNTNSVKVVDLGARRVAKTIKVGKGPQGVAVAGRKVYVCNPAYDFASQSYGPGIVSVIDSSTDEVVKTIDVETNPTEAVTCGGKVLVLCTGNYAGITGKLCIIDPDSDMVVETIDLGMTPSGIAVSPNGVAYITSTKGLVLVDMKSGSLSHTELAPGGSGLAVDRNGNIYICVPDWTGGGNDKLLIIDKSENLIGSYPLGRGASIITLKE